MSPQKFRKLDLKGYLKWIEVDMHTGKERTSLPDQKTKLAGFAWCLIEKSKICKG